MSRQALCEQFTGATKVTFHHREDSLTVCGYCQPSLIFQLEEGCPGLVEAGIGLTEVAAQSGGGSEHPEAPPLGAAIAEAALCFERPLR